MKSRTAEKNSTLLETQYAKNPQSRIFSRLADSYRKEGNFTKAIEMCINGLQIHPDYVTGRIVLGHCYIEQGNIDAAIQEYLAIFSYDRKNQVVIKMLADIFARKDMSEKAGDLYNYLLKMDPHNKSIEQLSKQYEPGGQTDVFAILGLPQPATYGKFQSTNNNSFVSDAVSSAYESAEEKSDYSPSNQFSSDDDVEVLGGSGILSGDLNERMDMLFGNSQTELSDASNDNQEEITDLTEVANSYSAGDKSITGEDISFRMDALFGDDSKKDTQLHGETDSFTDSIPTELTSISGDDVTSQIDSILGIPEAENLSSEPLFPDQIDNAMHFQANDIEEVGYNLPSSTLGDDTNNDVEMISFNSNEERNPLNLDNPDMPDFQGNDDSSEIISLRNDINSEISGDDFTAHLDSMIDNAPGIVNLNENTITTQDNDSIDEDVLSETIDFPSVMMNELSGDDISEHIENIISDEGSGTIKSDNDFNIQTYNISDDTTSAPGEMFKFPDNNSNDMMSLQVDISANDYQNPDFQQFSAIEPGTEPGQEVVSTDENEQSFSSEQLSGDDFSSHIDNLIGEENNSYLSGNRQNYQVNDDTTFADNNEQPFQQEQLSGEDFSFHLDKILGDGISEKATIPDFNNTYQKDDDLLDESIELLSSEEVNSAENEVSLDIDRTDTEKTALTDDTGSLQLQNLSNNEDGMQNTYFVEKEMTNEISDGQDSSEDNNITDAFSVFTNTEFEETLQFDRSIIDKVRDQIEVEQLTDFQAENTLIPEQNQESELIDFSSGTNQLFEIEGETLSYDHKELNSYLQEQPNLIQDQDDLKEDTNVLINDHADQLIVESEGDTGNNTLDDITEDNIIDIESSSPVFSLSPEIENLQTKQTENEISEMDILVSSSSDLNGMTGEDIVQKIDSFFPVEVNESDISNSTVSLENRSETVSGNDVEQRIDEYFNDKKITEIDQSQSFDNDEFINQNSELNMSTDSMVDKNVTLLDDSMLLIPTESEQDENNIRTQEISLTQNTEDEYNDEMLSTDSEKVQNVDPLFMPNVEMNGPDKAYSVPDHVLTPTLADIYYQQGQLQLAVQIYSRLYERDPDNLHLKQRIEEIQRSIELGTVITSPVTETKKKITEEVAKSETVVTPRQRKKASVIEKPLSGVRLKKKKK